MNSTPDPPPEPTGPDDPTTDFDARFDAIVAGMSHDKVPPEVPVWPVAEDDVEVQDEAAPTPALGSQWSGWEDVAVAAPDVPELDDPADHEHYVPPPPPPVPQGDRVTRWGWAGALGAPTLAVILAIAGWDLTGLVGLALVAAFLSGFVTLVSRLRDGPSIDDGPEDGAVI